MPARGTKPTDGPKHFRGQSAIDWTEVPDRPFAGKVPVSLPAKRELGGESVAVLSLTKTWWATIRKMPHCALWRESDWLFALESALVADSAFRGSTSASTELRQREKILGTTFDARRDLRIRYVSVTAPKAAEPEPGEKPKRGRAKVTNIDTARRDRLIIDDA